ncbi:MAG TPA: hypothetical protein VGB99_15670 [Acidobacteriota bacterium]
MLGTVTRAAAIALRQRFDEGPGLDQFLKRRSRQGWSKIRRFYLSNLRRELVDRKHMLRVGECHRCGHCCRILFRCPFLKGNNECRIYGSRFEQCRNFPIEPRDIELLDGRCGYSFIPIDQIKVS